MIPRWTTYVLVLLPAGLPCGCDPAPVGAGPTSAPPAKVVKEDDLNTILLTPEAESRLGVTTARVEKRVLALTRTLGGEVMVPPGLEITVSAPLAGEILAVSPDAMDGGAGSPLPGRHLKKGQAVFVLRPLLSPEAMISYRTSRVEATGEVEAAKVEIEAAKVTYDRAERLLRAKGGSQREVDDAKARLLTAEAKLKAALDRRDLLEKIEDDTRAGSPIAFEVRAPIDGILKVMHARAGQTVEAGASLFQVVRLDPVWVRVPVYAGDLPGFDEGKEVQVGLPGSARAAAGLRIARPVTAPPAADPDAATVDLFYELENEERSLRPGQKVGVTIPLRAESESLVVPWSAVVHDVHGGTWVYEQTAPHRFARRRVEVRRVDGKLAILTAGPPPGTDVVVEGVAELFGTEFGIGK